MFECGAYGPSVESQSCPHPRLCLHAVAFSKLDSALYFFSAFLSVLPRCFAFRMLMFSRDNLPFRAAVHPLHPRNSKHRLDSADSKTRSTFNDVLGTFRKNELVNKLRFILVESDELIAHWIIRGFCPCGWSSYEELGDWLIVISVNSGLLYSGLIIQTSEERFNMWRRAIWRRCWGHVANMWKRSVADLETSNSGKACRTKRSQAIRCKPKIHIYLS